MWWVWRVPGRHEELHLVLGHWGEVSHRVRELQRYIALAALERRRPATFGGLGAEVCRLACTQGMTVASSETERSLLRALQAGATWTGARVRKHQISDLVACPYCGVPRRRKSISFGTARGGRHSKPRGSRWCRPRPRRCRHWSSRQRGQCACAQWAYYQRRWSDQGRGIRRGGSCTACMACTWWCFRHAWERKSRHVKTQARAPRSLRSCADALPMHAGANIGDNWALAHIHRRHQRHRWLCVPARRRGGRGRHPSRRRSCSGPADFCGY